jgi:hypothetical protein
MTDERDVKERVEGLLRRSDGPMVIRPLTMPAPPRPAARTLLTSAVFVLVIVVSGAVAIGVIAARRQPVATEPSASAPTTTEAAASTRPSASFGIDFATADGTAAAIAHALESDDRQLLLSTLAPSGWYVRWFEQAQTESMTRNEAWNWILNSSSAKWQVDEASVRDADVDMPPGEKYLTALAIDRSASWPEQRAAILLRSIGGRWYWSSLLLFRPPPVGASSGEVNGYATVLNIADATLTVRFRTVGSRCCSDQSWNGRTVTLRREASTVYMGPGGTSATSLAGTGVTVSSDVWVHFALDSALPDGSYRLGDLAKMYP